MALKESIKKMNQLLEEIMKDMNKAEKGNKAASQRVRTGSIKLEKVAKLYRKESVAAEKGGRKTKKAATKKATKKTATKKAKKPVKKIVKKTVTKAKPKKAKTVKRKTKKRR